MKKFSLLLLFVTTSLLCYSQEVEMADAMHANGKIFVVVGVLVTILLGIVVYLVMIDRKVSELEKKAGKK